AAAPDASAHRANRGPRPSRQRRASVFARASRSGLRRGGNHGRRGYRRSERALPARVRDNAAVRADLRTLLLEAGASEDDVDRAEREGWLPLLTLDALVLPGAPTYDVAAMAAKTGVDEERLRRLWR